MRPAVRFNRLAGPAIVLLLVLVVAGCGRVPTSGVSPGQTASGERSPAPTISAPSPTPSGSDPTAGWQAFNSPNIGYSLKLPPTVKYVGSVTSGPDRADYFSNEDAGAPQEMDLNGVFFQIAVTHDAGDQCVKHDLYDPADRTDSLVMDGTPVTMNILTVTGSEGRYPGIVVNTQHGGYCYEVVFLARTAPVRDSYEQPALLMLGQTFRFR